MRMRMQVLMTSLTCYVASGRTVDPKPWDVVAAGVVLRALRRSLISSACNSSRLSAEEFRSSVAKAQRLTSGDDDMHAPMPKWLFSHT